MAVELLHCALEDLKDSANRSVVKMLAAECKGRAAAAAIAASRPDACSRTNAHMWKQSGGDDGGEARDCATTAAVNTSHAAAGMDQSTAILLQSFVGMHAAPAPWLPSAAAADALLPKRLQTRAILQRMNHAVEGMLAPLALNRIPLLIHRCRYCS